MSAGGGSGISWNASAGALLRDSATDPAMTTERRMAIDLADKRVLPRTQCKTRMNCRLRPSLSLEKTSKKNRRPWLKGGGLAAEGTIIPLYQSYSALPVDLCTH